MAHAICVAEVKKRSLSIEVYSGGILDFSDEPTLSETSITCLNHNTPPAKETPTWVGQLPLDSINRFLVMEQDHADALTKEFVSHRNASACSAPSIPGNAARRLPIHLAMTVWFMNAHTS